MGKKYEDCQFWTCYRCPFYDMCYKNELILINKTKEMEIFASRFTPNITGDEISLNIGEKVKYKLKNGNIIDAIIDSERMGHAMCSNLGYEAITLDDNERNFIDGKRIIWWKGKTGSMNELNDALKKA